MITKQNNIFVPTSYFLMLYQNVLCVIVSLISHIVCHVALDLYTVCPCFLHFVYCVSLFHSSFCLLSTIFFFLNFLVCSKIDTTPTCRKLSCEKSLLDGSIFVHNKLSILGNVIIRIFKLSIFVSW